MSRLNVNLRNEITEEKTKILKWIVKWIKSPKDSQHSNNTDAVEIASLLQCLGFTLNSFEKTDKQANSDIIENTIKVEITCLSSNMTATMSKPLSMCNCPSIEDAKNAEIWNVTGCEPKAERISISNSTILPPVSPSKNNVIAGLLQKIFNIINDTQSENLDFTTDIQNETHIKDEPVILKNEASCSNDFKNPIFVQPVEPIGVTTVLPALVNKQITDCQVVASPPKSTSSPLRSPMHRFRSYSTLSEKDYKLGNMLQQVIQISEEAYSLVANKNKTFSKTRISDIKKVSPSENAAISGKFINMNFTHSESFPLLTKTPKKNLTPKKIPSLAGINDSRKNLLPPPTKLGTIRKKLTVTSSGAASTPTTTKNLTPKADTPRPGYYIKEYQKKIAQKSTLTPLPSQISSNISSRFKSPLSKISVLKKNK